MRLTAGILVLAGLVVAGTRPAPAQTPAAHERVVPRDGIEALEAQLDRAIDRVSLPRPAALLGREAARGYRLPGFGIVFVLTPRTLPGPQGYDLLRPRHRVEYRRVRPRAASGEPTDEADALERQVIVLQHETEQARRAAEEDMERIVNDVRVRFSAPGELHLEVETAPRAEAPAPPSPPEAPLPPPPPWKYWFAAPAPQDTRTPEAVVGDVQRVLVEVLENSPGRVPGLGPEEFVTVAVDFEPAGLFARSARPEKTLVVRARVRDLDARARGALAAEELRRRVEVIEY
jgi:hypothetical protein